MKIDIQGHSGCDINVVYKDNEIRVIKKSNKKSYLNRLVKQAEKQVSFYNDSSNENILRAPIIYNINKTESSVEVEMEYIYSLNFIDFFEKANFKQIHHNIELIKQFIDKNIEFSKYHPLDIALFLDKYKDVKQNIFNNDHLKGNIQLETILKSIDKIFSNTNSIQIPYGYCHGDLTFSNILFNGDGNYLIDFLDSFIESPLIDIVKLRQDTCFRWSLQMYHGTYDKARLSILFDYIDNELDSYLKKYDWYTNGYTIFQIMNLIRVIQYANNKRTIDFLINALQCLLDNEE